MKPAAFLKLTSLFVLIAAALSFATPAGVGPPNVPAWHQAIRALRLPGTGCFTASFPNVQWQAVSCRPAPDVPFGPATEGSPLFTVGDGVDYSAVSSGGLLSSVTGSFPSVSAWITEKGVVPVPGNPKMANTFSLQLNSSFFSGSPACSAATKPKYCLAWQQFVYATSPDSAPSVSPQLFMQYWLIDYGPTCPKGWLVGSLQNSCYVSSRATSTPALSVSDLSDVSLEGFVDAGESDGVILSAGTTAYARSNPDSVVDLSAAWTTAEFGVFGDGNGTKAKFGAGTTMRVMTATNNGTTLAPACSEEGFTGETNNLNLVKTPRRAAGSTTGIVSEQSDVLTSSASCVSSGQTSDLSG